MPLFKTTAEAQAWCSNAFPAIKDHIHMTTIEWVLGGIVLAYIVGRIGLTQAWTDIKSVYATIRGWFVKPTVTSTQPA